MSEQMSVRVGLTSQKLISICLFPLTIYYWMLLLVHDPKEIVIIHSLKYFLFVIPSAVFVLIGVVFLANKKKTNISSISIALLVSISVAFSLYRNDISSLLSVTFLLLFIIVFSHGRPIIRLDLLNFLFLASVLFSLPLYHFGLSDYGYFPGQSLASSEEGLGWRVSLFPSIPESAMFSGIVLILNCIFKNLPFRRTVLFLAIYFLFFSAVRSVVIATIASIFYFVIFTKYTHKMPIVSLSLFIAILGTIIFLLYSESFLIYISGFIGDYLNVYLFHSAALDINPGSLSKTIYRTRLWEQHINALITSDYMGIGTFSFVDILVDPLPAIYEDARAWESFLTGFLARVGIWGLLLPIAIMSRVLISFRLNLLHVPVLAFMFISLSLTYGSFITPYNFVMILFLFLIFGQVSHLRSSPPKNYYCWYQTKVNQDS